MSAGRGYKISMRGLKKERSVRWWEEGNCNIKRENLKSYFICIWLYGWYVINWTIISIRNTYKKYKNKNKNINIYLFVMYFLLISNSLFYMLYTLIHVYAFAEQV